MLPPPVLNVFTPRPWVCVSGWPGVLEAKPPRGPLILWATLPEDLNRAALALACVRAAQGRRKSTGGPRLGFLRLWRGASRTARRDAKREYLSAVGYAALILRRREEGRRGIVGRAGPRTVKARKEARREWERDSLQARVERAYPSADPYEPMDAEMFQAVSELEAAFNAGHVPDWALSARSIHEDDSGTAFGLLMRHFLALGTKGTAGGLAAYSQRRAAHLRASLALARRFLEAAAYRARVTRRVRPPARRSRIRRPLYARPRPPTCPAAPPVA